jgi:aldehyde:ferredoxin oxidoreductase
MGYMNKILRVNLTKNAITEEKPDEKLYRNFVGGRGLGARIISDEVDPETDALSENNKLVFLAGPLTGTKAPTSGRFCASFKSPLTGTIADSQAGEKLSLISSVIVNGHRALGRAGIGSVMGSKNLKAVVAKGNQKIPIVNEEKFERAIFEANALIKEKGVTDEALPGRGTTVLVHVINMNGIFPVKNFQRSQWPHETAEKISGEMEMQLSKQYT